MPWWRIAWSSENVMCVGHLADQIVDYFGDGEKFGIKIVYSHETEKLDTGGAIKLAYNYLDETFFVIYGDSFLRQDFKEVDTFFNQHKTEGKGLMTVWKNENEVAPSQLLVDGIHVTTFQKAPTPPGAKHIEYGLNILPKDIITKVQGKTFPISDYFDLLIPKNEMLAFEVQERFYEIGGHDGLKQTEDFITGKKN